jgi:hypothetical protein
MNQKQMIKWQNYLKNGRLIGKMDIKTNVFIHSLGKIIIDEKVL